MRTSSFSRNSLLALLAVAFVSFYAACSDDDPVDPGLPQNSAWAEVELPADLPGGGLNAIAIFNNSSAAVGGGTDGSGILLENSSQGWRRAELPELESVVIQDVAIDAFGRRVLVGYTYSLKQWILEEGPPWRLAVPEPFLDGGLLAVASDGASTFTATGTAGASIAAWTGSVEGDWTHFTIQTPGDPNDKSLVDIAYGAGAWVGCGFDDGGEGTVEQPFSILMIDEGSGWGLINSPCGGCGNAKYEAVAVSQTGLIYLGGAITDFSGGGSEYTAFLRSYARDIEEWTEIDLPDPTSLGRVNEILLTPTGDIYLDCGVDDASLVRLPDGQSSLEPSNLEWYGANSRLTGLAVTGAGTVYAVGAQDLVGDFQPLMLSREPKP